MHHLLWSSSLVKLSVRWMTTLLGLLSATDRKTAASCLFVVGLLVVAVRQPVCFASRLDHTAKKNPTTVTQHATSICFYSGLNQLLWSVKLESGQLDRDILLCFLGQPEADRKKVSAQ